MTNTISGGNDQPGQNSSFEQTVTPLLTDLYYPSESDEPVELVNCYLKQAEPLTDSQVKDWLMLPPSVYVEERPEAEFWEPVTTGQDWYNEDEKNRTARFQQLKQVIDATLAIRQVFYVGETELDVYLLGLAVTGDRMGIQTKVVQT